MYTKKKSHRRSGMKPLQNADEASSCSNVAVVQEKLFSASLLNREGREDRDRWRG